MRSICLARLALTEGSSLLEAVTVVGLLAVLAASSPRLAAARDRYHATAAARYVAAAVLGARSDAAHRGAAVALRFQTEGGTVVYARFVDGNRNGVRSDDITRGVDRQDGGVVALHHLFPGVGFGLEPGVTDPDSGVALSGSAVRVGTAGLLSFSPAGTATSGTLYLRGRGGVQFAVRVLGGTGRVRLFRYNALTRTWERP